MPRHLPKPDYIYNKDFERLPKKVILGPLPPYPKQKKANKPRPDLPAYLKGLYGVPLLSKEQELYLFRKYNYLRWYRATKAKKPQLYDAEINATSNLIVTSNLRLSVHFARKFVNNDLFEMISAGNVGLMNACRSFDYSRGMKFSTYAVWAIKGQFHTDFKIKMRYEERTEQVDDEASFADPLTGSAETSAIKEEIRENIQRLYLCLSDERQKLVIKHRFGLDVEPLRLSEIGKMLGVSKERVRQIEVRALEELRFFAKTNGEVYDLV